MNIGDLKAFLGNKTQTLARASHSSELPQYGNNRHEVGKQGSHVSLTHNKLFSLSSNGFVGARVYNHSLNQSLTINEQKPNLPFPKKEQEKGLFDFEEVAKNVLSFVGGALKNAKAKGMGDDELNSMFEQARSGVLKGVNMAKDDLGGLMDDEISKGISKSQELIEKGIQSLEQQLFGKQQEAESAASSVSVNQSVNYTRQDSGQLTIRTRDGDEVSISFEDARQFSLNQQILIESQQKQQSQDNLPQEEQDAAINESPTLSDVADQTSAGASESQTAKVAEQPQQAGVNNLAEETQRSPTQDNELDDEIKVSRETQYQHYESGQFSYSVKGDLDEDELKAIGSLVADTGKLADEFFYGDIDKAFNQALEIGYDDQELTGFAFQLTSYQQTDVIKTYESVSHYNEQSENKENDAVKATKPVADYMEHMLKVVDRAQNLLEDGDALDSLINGLINQMPEVHTPDLIEAINRFRGFNQKLMDNLPQRNQTQ